MKFPAILLTSLAPALLLADAPPRLQSKVKGLLVVELPNGKTAGTASQMNATAVKSDGAALEIRFNQDVGETMNLATSEVSKFIQVRHHERLPEGYRIELSFADKYSPKDGPSAAVASALLVDSIVSDHDLSDDFAVTGDMIADGSIQPVGGIVSKIRGARLKGCAIVAVPEANETAVSDGYIIDGIRELRSIQIFSVATFDEAHALASENRGEKLAGALAGFSQVQQALARDEKFATNPKVLEKLREVIELAPNHLSAKYLYLHGTGRAPRTLSLVGSLMAIDEADTAFAQMLDDGSFTETSGNSDVLFKFEGELTRLKPMIDKRTADYCDSYLGLAQYIREIRGRRIYTPQMKRELLAAVTKVRNQRKALFSNEEIREELMLEE
ncbi:MAG TPA: S16 family serine protease [Luteolibacter sp.]|nr:S16 family serine protease [Luteolibacter sp.]